MFTDKEIKLIGFMTENALRTVEGKKFKGKSLTKSERDYNWKAIDLIQRLEVIQEKVEKYGNS